MPEQRTARQEMVFGTQHISPDLLPMGKTLYHASSRHGGQQYSRCKADQDRTGIPADSAHAVSRHANHAAICNDPHGESKY